MEQRGAAGDDEARLLGGRDDLQLEADVVAHPVEECRAIVGAPAGLGGDAADRGDAPLRQLAGADPERLDGARHRRLGQRAGGFEPLAEPDDPRKRIDDAGNHWDPEWRRAGDQKAAIIGAEIERGGGRGVERVAWRAASGTGATSGAAAAGSVARMFSPWLLTTACPVHHGVISRTSPPDRSCRGGCRLPKPAVL